MIFNIINLVRSLSKEDYNRFIKFLDESRNFPYFSTLYDQDDFNNDIKYFKKILEENLKNVL